MNAIRVLAAVLIGAGFLALGYGGFSYTKEKTPLKIGPVELSVKETERVNIPLWAGVAAIAVGGVLAVGTSMRR